MRIFPWCVTLLIAASVLPLQAEAAKKKTQKKAAATTEVAPPAPATQSPAEFADAFHEAMHSRNRERILPMLAPDLVVFETGYLEATRDEYVKDNLSDDTAFASATEYRPLSRGVIGGGDQVAVLTKASIKGTFTGQQVNLIQSETMILRRTPTAWEIVHLHWSGHPRQVNDSEPAARPAPPAPKVEPPSEPQTAPPAQPEAQPQPQPQPQPELQPETQPEPEPQAQVEQQPAASLIPATELTVPGVPEAKPEEAKTP